MKNVIEILGDMIPAATEAINVRLKEKYSIREFQLTVTSGPFRYQVNCYDAVNDFVNAYDDDLSLAIENLEKELTPIGAVKKLKLAKAKRMLAEALT